MKCSQFEKLEMKYLDGCLSREELKLMEEHMCGCDACAKDFALYKELQGELKGLTLPVVPDAFTDRVMSRVEVAPKPSGKLMVLVIASVLAAVSSVAGFLNLLAINSGYIAGELERGGIPSTVIGVVDVVATAGSSVVELLLKCLDLAYNSGLFVFVLMGMGLYLAVKNSRAMGGVRK